MFFLLKAPIDVLANFIPVFLISPINGQHFIALEHQSHLNNCYWQLLAGLRLIERLKTCRIAVFLPLCPSYIGD
jgi:hypothetical protein